MLCPRYVAKRGFCVNRWNDSLIQLLNVNLDLGRSCNDCYTLYRSRAALLTGIYPHKLGMQVRNAT